MALGVRVPDFVVTHGGSEYVLCNDSDRELSTLTTGQAKALQATHLIRRVRQPKDRSQKSSSFMYQGIEQHQASHRSGRNMQITGRTMNVPSSAKEAR